MHGCNAQCTMHNAQLWYPLRGCYAHSGAVVIAGNRALRFNRIILSTTHFLSRTPQSARMGIPAPQAHTFIVHCALCIENCALCIVH